MCPINCSCEISARKEGAFHLALISHDDEKKKYLSVLLVDTSRSFLLLISLLKMYFISGILTLYVSVPWKREKANKSVPINFYAVHDVQHACSSIQLTKRDQEKRVELNWTNESIEYQSN